MKKIVNFFSTNLKFLREKRGWSQEYLAGLYGDKTHQTTIGRWENKKQDPVMGSVIRTAEIFNISIIDLICRDLRIDDGKTSEEAKMELLKKALVEKGYMEEGEDLTKEKYDKLLEIYKIL